MSERKVLNKYIPPDYDPSVPPPKKKKSQGPNGGRTTVRLMLPFSMKCHTCGEYIYKGKKFNARKEKTGEKYFSIDILRFYIRCTRCAAEVTFVTDPKHADYAAERGASRNFEPWREEKLQAYEETELAESGAIPEEDEMEKLEQRTMDTKRQMQISDALDDLREKSTKRSRVNVDDAITLLHDESYGSMDKDERLRREQEEKEIEKEAQSLFTSQDGELVRRVSTDQQNELPKAVELVSSELTASPLPKFQAPKRTDRRKVEKRKVVL
ncbi:splicing factor [Schizosaccharomyces cryophilus OY26]|uniref:Splicing factor YJU2 n=1 Tax=Schizosaccharomyces cryophilus (strain OY26 / ATCC MYA-4695 / CBS 11777 / NBRC 106824 / NRRL Y48691) TaxID=653667 RepID=S9X1J7_SCHCR|nr:splicing factor [Schizosaccharomyces cryophilus OY26]EPY50977.1 splicing factor [Schizosaccharomyces cryophilus OY26]